MSELMTADCWLHFVFSYSTPLDVCEKRFREFSLAQDIYIRNELKSPVHPAIKNITEVEEAREKILNLLNEIIAEKQAAEEV